MLTWIVLRAAGVGAYLMLFASVAWGLIGTSTIGGRRIPRATATLVHQFTSTAAFLLLGVHLGGLLLDGSCRSGRLTSWCRWPRASGPSPWPSASSRRT